ncbi:MAG: RNA-guided endonuclease InsQ/TnpB family protein, partial [Methanobacterium sp.]
YRKLKQIKNRESKIIKDLNHKISRGIVEFAYDTKSGIRLEDLKGIHKSAKSTRSFRYSLNSWSFYQLKEMIEYKAKLLGVPVSYVDPRNTSKTCSKCGMMGKRKNKSFKCPSCGHVDNADVNAAFNISKDINSVYQSGAERDVSDGSSDTPKAALNQKAVQL